MARRTLYILAYPDQICQVCPLLCPQKDWTHPHRLGRGASIRGCTINHAQNRDLSLNQRVLGSSPSASTKFSCEINILMATRFEISAEPLLLGSSLGSRPIKSPHRKKERASGTVDETCRELSSCSERARVNASAFRVAMNETLRHDNVADQPRLSSIINRARKPTKNMAVIKGLSGCSCASTSSSSVTKYSNAISLKAKNPIIT